MLMADVSVRERIAIFSHFDGVFLSLCDQFTLIFIYLFYSLPPSLSVFVGLRFQAKSIGFHFRCKASPNDGI